MAQGIILNKQVLARQETGYIFHAHLQFLYAHKIVLHFQITHFSLLVVSLVHPS